MSERTRVHVHETIHEASVLIAGRIAELIETNRRAGRGTSLGLCAGSSVLGVYEELVRLRADGRLSFRGVRVFGLAEYWPISMGETQSLNRRLREALLDRVDIAEADIHLLDGATARDEISARCRAFEQDISAAGGLDCLLLGIGRNAHIALNEPGSPPESRTRLINLDQRTRMDAAGDFFGEPNVPRQALSIGIATLLEARLIMLLAFGEHKAAAVRRAVEDEPTAAVVASYLQGHANADFWIDTAAASELTRFKTPWLIGSLEELGFSWNERMRRRAVCRLSLELGKPILKLTTEDYSSHGLQELLAVAGSAYELNIEVFKSLQRTITGWPGGKPDTPEAAALGGRPTATSITSVRAQTSAAADDPEPDGPRKPAAPEAEVDVFPKRALVFSPHPDDDVISMGGTLTRLCRQGHEVHVAYQTSGNIAVFDEVALWHADLIAEFCASFGIGGDAAGRMEAGLRGFVAGRRPGVPDSAELSHLKSLIRRTEATAAAAYCGVPSANIHFLDLPFYETGTVQKKPLGEADLRLTAALLENIRPHQVYAAGDLSDPHGTHRVCLEAVLGALRLLSGSTWTRNCRVWLYRGAWQEWAVEDIDMAVPLSPDEVVGKRLAIFRHQSQKDKAMFPGLDDREFWQRAEERNRGTARLYDRLGLPEYEAIEGFVRWSGS